MTITERLQQITEWQPGNTRGEVSKARYFIDLEAVALPEEKHLVQAAALEYTKALGSTEHTQYVWQEARAGLKYKKS